MQNLFGAFIKMVSTGNLLKGLRSADTREEPSLVSKIRSDSTDHMRALERMWSRDTVILVALTLSVMAAIFFRNVTLGFIVFGSFIAAAAVVPEIIHLNNLKGAGTDGVLTSFIALGLVSVLTTFPANGNVLYAARVSQIGVIEAWSVLVLSALPFALHLVIIWQISKYNSENTADSKLSKMEAKLALPILAISYILAMSYAVYTGTRPIRTEAAIAEGPPSLHILPLVE